MKSNSRNKSRLHRKRRIRAKVSGSAKRPRICVFKSNKILYAQLIDDSMGVTLAEIDTRQAKKAFSIEGAKEIGKLVAKKAKELKLKEFVFDRGGYKYHGKVKAFAEALREEGLKF